MWRGFLCVSLVCGLALDSNTIRSSKESTQQSSELTVSKPSFYHYIFISMTARFKLFKLVFVIIQLINCTLWCKKSMGTKLVSFTGIYTHTQTYNYYNTVHREKPNLLSEYFDST